MNRLPIPKQKTNPDYRKLWRVIDGAVRDAFKQHPDYIQHVRKCRQQHIRASVVKRVTGQMHGLLSEKGRPDHNGAVANEDSAVLTEPPTHYWGLVRKLARMSLLASNLFRRGNGKV